MVLWSVASLGHRTVTRVRGKGIGIKEGRWTGRRASSGHRRSKAGKQALGSRRSEEQLLAQGSKHSADRPRSRLRLSLQHYRKWERPLFRGRDSPVHSRHLRPWLFEEFPTTLPHLSLVLRNKVSL